jgi:hypothetical protein
MPLKDFLKSYKVKMRELGDDEVVYHIWEKKNYVTPVKRRKPWS